MLALKNAQANGRTALLRALHADRPALAKLLLSLGANPRATDSDGKDCQDLVASIKDGDKRAELTALCKLKKGEYGCFRMRCERSGESKSS